MNWALRWLLLWLGVGLALRVYCWATYPAYGSPVGLWEFALGTANDLQSFMLAAGVVGLGALVGRRTMRGALVLMVAVALIVLAAEVFFWFEFESRLDRLVFHYLAYPHEVLVFLDEQFYLSLFVVPFAAVVWLLIGALGWPETSRMSRSIGAGAVAGGILVGSFGGPLGASESRLASEFISNGYLGVLRDARFDVRRIPWLKGTAAEYPAVPRSAAIADPELAAQLAAKRHLVLIIEESLAGPVWRDPQLRQRFLPQLSALAADSIEFTRVYATGSRTTRGMEAVLNGFPPLPGISTTERGGYGRLPSLPRAMEEGGFYPVFLYGGWPGFSNFSNYWTDMGFRRIWSREDFDEEFETSWGVADGALLQRIVREMEALTRQHDRVFLATLTVSNHRPFEFPTGVIEFPGDGRRSEYAMAYADHALGEFMAAARASDWYDDTLFVVLSDHGLQPRGDELIPVESYRIPLLIHGAGIAARQLSRFGSSISIPSTLVTAFGIETEQPFSGGNLLSGADTIVPVEYGYGVGLLSPRGLGVIDRNGKSFAWRYDAEAERLIFDPAADAPRRSAIVDYFAPALAWYHRTTE